jgi:hypothetical protein
MRHVRWWLVFVKPDGTVEPGPNADNEADARRMRERLNEIEACIKYKDGRYEIRNDGV